MFKAFTFTLNDEPDHEYYVEAYFKADVDKTWVPYQNSRACIELTDIRLIDFHVFNEKSEEIKDKNVLDKAKWWCEKYIEKGWIHE